MAVHTSWRSTVGWAIVALSLAGCTGAHAASTPTPTPAAPEPSIGADGRALPGFVTIADDLPAAARLPDATLAASEQGWALGIYRPSVTRLDATDALGAAGVADSTHEAAYQVVYLATPGGERFQVLELDPEPALRLVDWVAGETTAMVFTCANATCRQGVYATLDLVTGETSPIEGFPENMTGPAARVGDFSLWTQSDGASTFPPSGSTWVREGGTWTPLTESTVFIPFGLNDGVSPDGRHVALSDLRLGDLSALLFIPAVLSIDGLELVRPPFDDDAVDCRLARWLDAATLVMDCRRGPGLVAWHIDSNTLDPFGDSSFVYGSGTPCVWPSVAFADGSIAGSIDNGTSEQHVGHYDGHAVTELVATDENGGPLAQEWVLDSSGPTVALGATRSEEGVALTSLHLWTLGDAAPVVAFPEVTGSSGSRVDPNIWRVESLTSFTLAR